MKLIYIVPFTLLYSALGQEISRTNSKWQDFKIKFSKNYETEIEESVRFGQFMKNVKVIEEHNANPRKTYTKGINKFSDLSFNEFSDIYLMKPHKVNTLVNGELPYPEADDQFECPTAFKKSMDIPAEYADNLDWRAADITQNPKGRSAVVAVKDQGQCGSCYVFSATGAMEGSACMNGFFNCDESAEQRFKGFSEQQALDCASYDDSVEERNWYVGLGCHGGYPSNTLEYYYNAKGIECEWSKPYESGNASRFDNDLNIGECFYTPATQYNYFKERSHGFIKKTVCGTTSKNSNTNPDDVKQALFEKGPLSMAMYVSADFHAYEGGIYMPDDDCAQFTEVGLNHALLFVGYGSEMVNDEKVDYWIIKNSWSSDWGENGFVKVQRGVNACGCEGNIAYVDMDRIFDEEPETTTEAETTTETTTVEPETTTEGSGGGFW